MERTYQGEGGKVFVVRDANEFLKAVDNHEEAEEFKNGYPGKLRDFIERREAAIILEEERVKKFMPKSKQNPVMDDERSR